MNTHRFSLLSFLAGALLALAPHAAGAGSADPSEQAWRALVQATQGPEQPAAWRTQQPTREEYEAWRKEAGDQAMAAAAKARTFYTAYPDAEHAAEARQLEYQMLQTAVQFGNTAVAERLNAVEAERLNDPATPAEVRVQIRSAQVQREIRAKMDQGPEAYYSALEQGARRLIAEFPGEAAGYGMLLSVASRQSDEEARAIATEIRDADRVPEELKERAAGLLRKLDALGKPLEISFTALDDRQVDLQEMDGKVVLIDFWATWCGPCVAELPNVKAAYDRLHPRGFEIVGISFDNSKAALEGFVEKHEMPWPQFFDGKGWANEFGRHYGINAIPTMWLVDKRGILRDQSARANLEQKVEDLLKE